MCSSVGFRQQYKHNSLKSGKNGLFNQQLMPINFRKSTSENMVLFMEKSTVQLER